jgi:hypothetical protein
VGRVGRDRVAHGLQGRSQQDGGSAVAGRSIGQVAGPRTSFSKRSSSSAPFRTTMSLSVESCDGHMSSSEGSQPGPAQEGSVGSRARTRFRPSKISLKYQSIGSRATLPLAAAQAEAASGSGWLGALSVSSVHVVLGARRPLRERERGQSACAAARGKERPAFARRELRRRTTHSTAK